MRCILLSLLFCGFCTFCSQESLTFQDEIVEFNYEINPKFNINVDLEFDYPVVPCKSKLEGIVTPILSNVFETPTETIITDTAQLLQLFFGIDDVTAINRLYLSGNFDNDVPMTYIKTAQGDSLFANDEILSYAVSSYTYAGGAHGFSRRSYMVFDLETGKQLSEKDIFSEDYTPTLTEILLNKLSEQADISTFENYFLDEVKPNENFFVNEKGISYFFNLYEIAPYSLGDFEIFIPYDEVVSVLKPTSPIRTLIN